MFRNQYDTDITTWSPAGRLHQVEYAAEAIKHGSACVGILGKKHVILASLKRATSEIASPQRKIFDIDTHIAMAMAGYMRNECLNHKFVFDSPMPLARLVTLVADRSQVNTQRSSKRPYGVGLLIGGVDSSGPRLFQTDSSGNYFEYQAIAIGGRSQAAKTYLEKHFQSFKDEEKKDTLIKHAISALKSSVPSGDELTTKNCSLAVVGVGEDLQLYDDEATAQFLALLEEEMQE